MVNARMEKQAKGRIKWMSAVIERIITNFKYCIMSDGPPATTSCGMELKGQFSMDIIAKF